MRTKCIHELQVLQLPLPYAETTRGIKTIKTTTTNFRNHLCLLSQTYFIYIVLVCVVCPEMCAPIRKRHCENDKKLRSICFLCENDQCWWRVAGRKLFTRSAQIVQPIEPPRRGIRCQTVLGAAQLPERLGTAVSLLFHSTPTTTIVIHRCDGGNGTEHGRQTGTPSVTTIDADDGNKCAEGQRRRR